MRVHLDTDIGGDPDDACALAMLLGWPGVELVGVTTAIDPDGLRAGCAAHVLRLAGREEVPLAAGAAVSLTTGRRAGADPRAWPRSVAPRPSPAGAALDLLERSVAAGATVVATGPYGNLALLEMARPGSLARTPVVLMGGWVRPPAAGLPAWGPDMDWNVQWDTRSAEVVVAGAAALGLATLPATLRAPLRAADLPRLRACGPLGGLLARQSEARAEEAGMRALGRAHAGLPDDLLNFHYDPVACAVALCWPGAVVEELRLRPVLEGGVLRLEPDPGGRPARVLVDVDGPAFSEAWLAAVETAAALRPGSDPGSAARGRAG
ncbi:MAG: nucleoside hydrolase [Chloroflexi bacterium]|nr:MAG: nucleoside hydrolase [Chloroflexota bacterium]